MPLANFLPLVSVGLRAASILIRTFDALDLGRIRSRICGHLRNASAELSMTYCRVCTDCSWMSFWVV